MKAGRPRERGGAILLVLLALLSLAMLTALGLLAAHADLLVACRRHRERESFYAVQAGMERALVSLNHTSPPLLPSKVFFEPWEDVSFSPPSEALDGWTISWRLTTVPDTGDADGDPSTLKVLFNRSFGYEDSPFDSRGFPVFHLRVLAGRGDSRKALVAPLAPVSCRPDVEAAWTTAGATSLAGNFHVSGREHDFEGVPVPGQEDPGPAFAAAAPVILLEGASRDGAVQLLAQPLSSSLLGFLNAGGTLASLEELPPPSESEEIRGIVFSTGDYRQPLGGEGMLVIHNPGFLPLPYEASRVALEEGVFTPDFDPSYFHLDPDHQPAVLDLAEGGYFRGLIVADGLADALKETTVIGAVVTLSRSPSTVRAEAPVRILHSGKAVERAGRGPLLHRLGFKVLPGMRKDFP